MTARQTLGIASCILLLAALGGCGAATAKANAPSSAASSKTAPAPIKAGSATVNGKQEAVLTTATGMTVYYFAKDTSTSSACTGACSSSWPPLLAKGAPSSPAGLSGALTEVKDQHGEQLAYNGHLLYTYAGDSAPGQANGEGLAGEWWVATPSLAAAGSSAASSSGW